MIAELIDIEILNEVHIDKLKKERNHVKVYVRVLCIYISYSSYESLWKKHPCYKNKNIMNNTIAKHYEQ